MDKFQYRVVNFWGVVLKEIQMNRSLFKKLILATCGVFFITISSRCSEIESKAPRAIAEWTVLSYIQADNDLAPFADYNICDMEYAFKTSSNTDKVNMLVQWDQPRQTKTWRYKITPKGRVDAGSLAVEMGVNPGKEIVDSMKWASANFPAKRYALVLWNHGSGVQDLRHLNFDKTNKTLIDYKLRSFTSWIEIPGQAESSELVTNAKTPEERGILYDDSQHTCLTNPDMANALQQISSPAVLGKKLDLLGMDACLMAMLEVAYQVRNYADILVSSQQTEPGTGWPYDGVLVPLLANPSMTNTQLATVIANAYRNFYSIDINTQDYTQSGINLNAMTAIKNNINDMIEVVSACQKYDSSLIKNAFRIARSKSIEFAISDYIDLYSFYSAFLNAVSKSKPKSEKIIGGLIANNKAGSKPNPDYDAAVSILKHVLVDGLAKIQNSVFVNVVGPQVSSAKGLSIYCPLHGFHSSYSRTYFAQETNWVKFVNSMQRS